MKKTLSVLIALLCIIPVFSSCDAKSQELSFSDSNDTTSAVYRYLCSVEGEKCLSAQQESTWMNSPEYEMEYIFDASGKYPAIRGLDYMNDDFDGVNKRAVEWWNKGGLVTICWHTGADFSGAWKESQETEIADWDKTLTEGTDEYRALIKGMDKAADALLELKEKGVTVIWRPFHEADGGWFWWGKGSSENFVRLWRIMYKHFTVERKLDNLIWVQGFSHNGEKLNKWYVGDGYCDIIGADSYDGGEQKELYSAVKKVHAANKPICFHECGENPTAEQLKDAGWLWFMTWHTEYLTDNNPKEKINALYNSDYVITLDELPEFVKKNTQESSENDADISLAEPIPFKLENLLDAVEWLGKSESEIDVPDEHIASDGYYKQIDIEGFLFGKESRGTAYFSSNDGGKEPKVDRLYLTVSSYSYEDCEDELEKLYGKPLEKGEEPFVESLGGVVSRTVFETDNLRIRMEMASGHNFFTVEFTLRNNET